MADRTFKISIWLVTAALFSVLLWAGPQLFPDSSSYLLLSLTRPPGYPLFISLFRIVFGNAFLTFLCAAQILTCLLSVFWLTFTLKERMKLSVPTAWAAYFLLVSPLLPFPLITGLIGNAVLSEALAYPMLLAATAFLVRYVTSPKATDAYACLGLMTASTLVRPQFLFLYPAAILFILHAWSTETTRRRRLTLAAVALIAFIFPPVFSRLYNKTLHYRSTAPELTGAYLLTQLLYMSDAPYIPEQMPPDQQQFLREAYSSMEAQKFTAGYRYEVNASLAGYLESNYNRIFWNVVARPMQNLEGKNPDEIRKIEAMEKIFRETSKPLFKHGFKGYLKLVLALIMSKMPFYLSLFLVFVLFSSRRHYMKTGDEAGLLVSLITTMNFSNYLLVAAMQPLLNRYTFYTDILQVVFLLCYFQHLNMSKTDA